MLNHAGRSPAILLVEDDPGIVRLLHRLIERLIAGYDIVPLDTGAAALAQALRRPVPLVFTDFSLVGMNGMQLTTALKELSPATCVVLMTGRATPAMEHQAQAHGVDYYLPKPFQIEVIEQIVRTVLA